MPLGFLDSYKFEAGILLVCWGRDVGKSKMVVGERGAKAKCWTFVYKYFPENAMGSPELEQLSEEYLIAAKVKSKVNENLLQGYIIFKCQKRANQAEAVLNIEGRPERQEMTIVKPDRGRRQQKMPCWRSSGKPVFTVNPLWIKALSDNKWKSRDKECSKNFNCDRGRKQEKLHSWWTKYCLRHEP